VLNGTVNQQGWAIVRITVCHPQAQYRQDLDAMVDTGCSVDLVLSSLDIAALGLLYSHTQVIQLADGGSHSTKVYFGAIEWFGTRRLIEVYESGRGLPLLGAPLLTPHTLLIDYAQRTVEIR
jgi:predicted aspartyl protease